MGLSANDAALVMLILIGTFLLGSGLACFFDWLFFKKWGFTKSPEEKPEDKK